jgi:hypothetical protein
MLTSRRDILLRISFSLKWIRKRALLLSQQHRLHFLRQKRTALRVVEVEGVTPNY